MFDRPRDEATGSEVRTPDTAAHRLTARAVFDRANSQLGMIDELRKVVRDAPRLGQDSTTEQREAWIRHVIDVCRLADVKVRPTRAETWAEAFERVHGEALA